MPNLDQTPAKDAHAPRRRWLLGSWASLAGLAGASASSQAQPGPPASKAVVLYWSRTGNTRLIARQIARANSADIFEIQASTPYPEDYRETVAQAQRETETGFEPALAPGLPDLSGRGTVFLGFPIWGMTAPPPIRSFLARHELAGKTLVPFITHGGYGTGSSLSVLSRMAPRARIMDAFVMQADQERDTLERVTGWLKRNPTRP